MFYASCLRCLFYIKKKRACLFVSVVLGHQLVTANFFISLFLQINMQKLNEKCARDVLTKYMNVTAPVLENRKIDK